MGMKFVRAFFFSNVFVGLLAITLSVETSFQLRLPLNSAVFYLLLFAVTIVYYTYAYTGAASRSGENPRAQWYRHHQSVIRKGQWFLAVIIVALLAVQCYRYSARLLHLPLVYWLLALPAPVAALLYYGLLLGRFFNIKLRNTGWLKAFIIGFVWAGCVTLLPVVSLKIEHGLPVTNDKLVLWLFIQNLLFCSVNAIMFDIKDYADDTNHQLKTFVVRIGLRRTIYFLLIPLLLLGLAAFVISAGFRHLSVAAIAWNVVPYLCLLYVTWSLQKRQEILYYLIVIDGLLLVKAGCGIAGMLLN